MVFFLFFFWSSLPKLKSNESLLLLLNDRFAVILAFDVKVERDAQEMADSLGVKIFQADIIYHLFDSFMAYRKELIERKRAEFKDIAVFPCKLRVLPQVTTPFDPPIKRPFSLQPSPSLVTE